MPGDRSASDSKNYFSSASRSKAGTSHKKEKDEPSSKLDANATKDALEFATAKQESDEGTSVGPPTLIKPQIVAPLLTGKSDGQEGEEAASQ